MLASVLVVSLLVFGPRRMRYSIEGGELHVRTLFGHKRWPVREVRARRYEPQRMWRVAGSSVPGYFTAVFRESSETVRVYATDLKRGVLIEAPVRAFLSPADPSGFLEALRTAGAAVGE